MIIQAPKDEKDGTITSDQEAWRLVVAPTGQVISLVQAQERSRTYTKNDVYEIPLYAIKRVSEPTNDSPLSGLKLSSDLAAEDFQAIQTFCDLWQSGESYPVDKLLIYDNRIYRTTEAHISQAGQTPDVSELYEDLIEGRLEGGKT